MKNTLQVYNYNIQNTNDNTLDVYIDGAIVDAETQQILKDWYGDDTSVSFKSVRDEVLKSGANNINFWLNSYGGHVGDAMAMHDWIQNLEANGYNINTTGLGMVCSATTYVLSASKNSKISKNSFYMIHNVSGGVWGDVNVIENYGKIMRKFNDIIVDFYVNLTGKNAQTVTDWMNAETWFTGKEAVANGFVKELLEDQPFTNLIPADAFPYKNTSALNFYNSHVKNINNPENDNDMKNLTTLLVNALKEAGFITNKEGETAKPITEEALTNAFNTALKDFKPEVEVTDEQIGTSVANFFKDGLPESIQNQITTAITDTLKESLKDVLTTDSLEDIKNDIKDLQDDAASNKGGGAKPKNKGGDSNDVHAKFEYSE